MTRGSVGKKSRAMVTGRFVASQNHLINEVAYDGSKLSLSVASPVKREIRGISPTHKSPTHNFLPTLLNTGKGNNSHAHHSVCDDLTPLRR